MPLKQPPPCDPKIFKNGVSLLAANTYQCGANGFEEWVKQIARDSGQKVDWHYSGHIAHVLYLGDIEPIMKAVEDNPCPAMIMHYYAGTGGLYRAGDSVPEGTIGGFYDPLTGGTSFIVSDKE